MTDTTVKVRTTTWKAEVKRADPEPEQKPTYEFSNGRKFYERGGNPQRIFYPATNE